MIEETSDGAVERAAEGAAEGAAERAAEKAARPAVVLKVEPELIALRAEMVDVDDIFGLESPSLRHVKLIIWLIIDVPPEVVFWGCHNYHSAFSVYSHSQLVL